MVQWGPTWWIKVGSRSLMQHKDSPPTRLFVPETHNPARGMGDKHHPVWVIPGLTPPVHFFGIQGERHKIQVRMPPSPHSNFFIYTGTKRGWCGSGTWVPRSLAGGEGWGPFLSRCRHSRKGKQQTGIHVWHSLHEQRSRDTRIKTECMIFFFP